MRRRGQTCVRIVIARNSKSTDSSLFAGDFPASHACMRQRADSTLYRPDTQDGRRYASSGIATRASADRAGIRADERRAPSRARGRRLRPAACSATCRTPARARRSPRRDSGKSAPAKPAAAAPKRAAAAQAEAAPRRPTEARPAPPPKPARAGAGAGGPQGGGLEDIAWAGVAAAAEAATIGVRLASRAIEALRGSSERGLTVPRPVRRSRGAPARFLRVFWERAYRENITGLAAMVAYNLALALFPFALLVLFIFGQVIKNPDVEASVLRDLQSIFPAAEQELAGQRRRPDPRQLDHDRGRRRDRRDLDRRLVLGRDGHRLLPHLPRRVPRLGRAEALRPGDAARGHHLPRRQRRDPGRRGRARLGRREPAVRPRRGRRRCAARSCSAPRWWSPSRSAR